MDRNQLYNDPEQAMRLVLDGRQSSMWTAMPAIVQSVDFSTMSLSAQITIQGTVEDENGALENVNLPVLIHCPICYPSAGGFTLTLPVKANDEVLIVFASRCIDAWWQSGKIGVAMEARMHDLSDGFAILGPKSIPKVIGSISTDGAQLRNDAGTTYLEIAADGSIKMQTPSQVSIFGNVIVHGLIGATGDVVASLGLASAITLLTHRHGGVTIGSADTGVPL